MHVLILGAGGMLGGRLAARLARDGALAGRPLARLTLADLAAPAAPPAAAPVGAHAVDLAAPGAAAALLAGRPDVIYHLAAVVSGQAEDDLELGYRVNLDGTRALLEAIRAVGDGYRPRVVFSSSLAVFGGPLPELVGDDLVVAPQTSYGTQKAAGELLLADHARRGLIEAVSLRLPTICVRPGAPNRAASGCFSNILREPLAGQAAVLPVPVETRVCLASPRAALGWLVHAAVVEADALRGRPALTMPAVSTTVAGQLEALERAGGAAALARVRHAPDAAITAIVTGWPARLDATRALALGFVGDASIDAIVAAHVEDELGGRVAAG